MSRGAIDPQNSIVSQVSVYCEVKRGVCARIHWSCAPLAFLQHVCTTCVVSVVVSCTRRRSVTSGNCSCCRGNSCRTSPTLSGLREWRYRRCRRARVALPSLDTTLAGTGTTTETGTPASSCSTCSSSSVERAADVSARHHGVYKCWCIVAM